MSLSTKTIGIIGGGQLGQMMAISALSTWAIRRYHPPDPAADCPSSRLRSSWHPTMTS